MNNRRNFYRILRVQPDAVHEVIRQSYRSLMQKLRLHPDLGGKHYDARIINQAYTTLRNPLMRAAYDTELFSRYSIKTLSSGGIFSSGRGASAHAKAGNQRNYYRILQVQQDAELEIIKASYRTLSSLLAGEKQSLLDEAFMVIGDIKRRLQYDALRRLYTHVVSVEKLKEVECLNSQSDCNAITLRSVTAQGGNPGIKQKNTLDLAYQAAIRHCCKFCKMPFVIGDLMEQERYCRQCASPLFSPAANFINAPRRSLPRMQQSVVASIYMDWPGESMQVLLEDLSPTGVNFSASHLLDIDQLIKIDAHHFKAIAKVVHCRSSNSVNNIGATFVTVEFLRTTGSFVSTSA